MWRVRSVRVNGRELPDGHLEAGFDGLIQHVEIEAVRDWAMVWGFVRTHAGAPVVDAPIVLLPAEDNDRRPASTARDVTPLGGRSRPGGRYVLPNVPPGTYDAFAVPADEGWTQDDEDRLQRWRAHATRVTVAPGQSLELNLVPVALDPGPLR